VQTLHPQAFLGHHAPDLSTLERVNNALEKNNKEQSEEDLKKGITPFMDEVLGPIKHMLSEKYRAIILHLSPKEQSPLFSFQQLHQLNPLLGEFFGELLIQNEQGDTVISVYDRDREGSMWKGARYHQTREGGSIHTDNVNIPEPWDYLYLSCLAPGLVGGENILVDGLLIHQQLKQYYPKALKILEEPYYWEMRGVADSLYQAPIITYNDKREPLFRHLRPYMESAHYKANAPMSAQQMYAVDVLDALLNNSDFQVRYRMRQGDVLISKDAQVLHGRTCFSDALEAVDFHQFQQGKGQTLKRTMERLWIKCPTI
jgi:alpha-ketoglutarate-dependent taurine dioxygenase